VLSLLRGAATSRPAAGWGGPAPPAYRFAPTAYYAPLPAAVAAVCWGLGTMLDFSAFGLASTLRLPLGGLLTHKSAVKTLSIQDYFSTPRLT